MPGHPQMCRLTAMYTAKVLFCDANDLQYQAPGSLDKCDNHMATAVEEKEETS